MEVLLRVSRVFLRHSGLGVRSGTEVGVENAAGFALRTAPRSFPCNSVLARKRRRRARVRSGSPGRSESTPTSAAGGGSKTGGGDPTTTGRAQEVGNRHLGTLYSRRTTTTTTMVSSSPPKTANTVSAHAEWCSSTQRFIPPPAPGFVSNGFYNPRTRIYLEGNFTKPIQYEFSLQNTFDSVGLLDAYVNFNYDSRFQAARSLQDAVHLRMVPCTHLGHACPRAIALCHELRE